MANLIKTYGEKIEIQQNSNLKSNHLENDSRVKSQIN